MAPFPGAAKCNGHNPFFFFKKEASCIQAPTMEMGGMQKHTGAFIQHLWGFLLWSHVGEALELPGEGGLYPAAS